MKKLVFPFLSLIATLASGQDTKTNAPIRIPAAQARTHLGAEAIVFGKVAEVNISERVIRLNLDKPFPSQAFTAVIFAAKTNLFPELDKLKGKEVEIRGTIADYRGRAEIVLTMTNQLRVLELAEPKK